jgi:hypothetical protein
MTTTPAAPAADAPAPAPPAPVSCGRYALYETPGGGRHLVYRPDGEAEDAHVDIPPFIMNMAQRAMNGEGPGLLGKLMGGGE